MSRKKAKSKLPPFVPVIKTTMATPAWRAMSFGARLLYLELRGCLRNDYLNNGKVFRSCRDAAKALGTQSTRSIVRWYAELEHYGFLRKTAEGFLGADGRGIAAHHRFTEFRCGTHPPTRDFEKWDGELFAYTPRRPDRKKQNPVSPRDTPGVPQGHIRKGSKGSSVCAPQGHIDAALRCAPRGHTSRKASRETEPCPDQGSLTARAPVELHAASLGSGIEVLGLFCYAERGSVVRNGNLGIHWSLGLQSNVLEKGTIR
jgi:hypothetical protein